MATALTPARSALGGTSILMACACGAASNSVKLLALAGLTTTTALVHPALLGIGAGLIVYGLWRTARPSAYLALAAFGVLAAAALITPAGVMTVPHDTMWHGRGLPWNGTQMAGAALYVVAATLLGYAFWRAFPSRKPAASAAAIGGAALATGCTCCMVTGAVAGMAVTAGASAAYFESMPILFWVGLGVVAAGLYRLGGIRAAAWVPLGGLIVRLGFSIDAKWPVGDANLTFVPKYLIYLAGTAVIMYGFAVAYRTATRHERPESLPAPTQGEPLLGTAGGN
jgi:hypothetical protein